MGERQVGQSCFSFSTRSGVPTQLQQRMRCQHGLSVTSGARSMHMQHSSSSSDSCWLDGDLACGAAATAAAAAGGAPGRYGGGRYGRYLARGSRERLPSSTILLLV